MADNKENRIHKSSIEREQSQTCLNSTERENIKGSKNLNVPHLRFPEFSGEWEKCKLSEVCSFFSGGTPSSSKKEYYNGSIPFIRSGEIHVNKTELFITEEGLNNSAAKKVEIGDLLLALYGATSGDIAISQINGAINQAILCIRTTQNKKFIESVWKKHVNKLLQTYLQGGQGNLSADIVKNISFYLTSNIEQNKLARLVSLLDKRISTQNKIIEDLKLLKSAIRKKVFVSLKEKQTESCEIDQLLTYEQPTAYIVTNDEYSTDTTLIPVLTANKGFVLGYTDEDFSIYQKGECIIFDDFTMDAKYVSFPFKVKSSAIKILTAKPNVNLRFIFEYLLYLELKSAEHKRHYISEIASLVVELPLKEIQNKIASLMTLLDNKLALEENTKVKYEDEKQYLLSQMFI